MAGAMTNPLYIFTGFRYGEAPRWSSIVWHLDRVMLRILRC